MKTKWMSVGYRYNVSTNMKPEQAFYQKLRPFLPGQVTRIENGAVPGLPDVLVTHVGTTAWIELKVMMSTRDNSLSILLRKEQYAWNHQCAKNGGRNFIFAMEPWGRYIHVFRYPMVEGEAYGTSHKYVRIVSPAFIVCDWGTVGEVITNLFPN